MAFQEKCAVATLNSTTPVTLVAAPAAGEVIVIRSVNIENKDTANANCYLRVNKNGAVYPFQKNTITTLLAEEMGFGNNRIVLADTDESLEVATLGAITLNNPVATAHYAVEN